MGDLVAGERIEAGRFVKIGPDGRVYMSRPTYVAGRDFLRGDLVMVDRATGELVPWHPFREYGDDVHAVWAVGEPVRAGQRCRETPGPQPILMPIPEDPAAQSEP